MRAIVGARSRPVREVLLGPAGGRRGAASQAAAIHKLARDQGLTVRQVSAAELDRYFDVGPGTERGGSHGGVAVVAGPRWYSELSSLAADPGSGDGPAPWVVMLDGVEDPYNFAHAVRALYAAGAAGLILRPRNWTSAAGLVARASAGASERMPTAIVNQPMDAVEHFRARGFRVVTTANDAAAVTLFDADLAGPLLVMLGGEKRGVQRSVRQAADVTLRIAYGRHFGQSLGVVAAAAAVGFELLRQRGKVGGGKA